MVGNAKRKEIDLGNGKRGSARSGISLESLVHYYLLAHQTEWGSRHTAAYYDGILNRLLWHSQKERWPREAGLVTEWHIRAFLEYVRGTAPRWGLSGNGSESSRRRASPRTVHHYYAALRALFNWAKREGHLRQSPMLGVRVPQPKAPVILPFSPAQVKAMLAICRQDYQGNNFLGSRNEAIVLVLYDGGPRLAELAGMKLRDVDWEEGWIRVLGKGAKPGLIRIGKTAQEALRRYLVHRHDSGNDEVWLTEDGHLLKPRAIQSMVERLVRRAGINESGGCHRFRRSFAVQMLRGGANLFSVQYLLRHTDISQVQQYAATLGMYDALEAHKKASPADNLGLE
ncbi:Tyrosine recombinase XerC [subsurface metagenome]